jgi:Cft2 family RNA processing exonuclease
MLQCFFYGTGQSDEGICVEVQIAHHRILLDCGLRDISVLQTLEPPDLILCSHADPDNSRSLLGLHKKFPDVPIYSSTVTAELIGLGSSLSSPLIQTLEWRSSTELLPSLTVQLFPAGHLPGAAIVLLTDTSDDRPQTLLYAPDLSLTNSRLTDGLKLEELRGLFPDVLLISGAYGTDRYPHRRQLETQLMEMIDRALISGQSVFLPVPALGLAQEILILLRSHHLFSGRSVMAWVDDPIADQCDRYEQIIPTFPSSIQNFARYQSLFLDSTIRPCIQRLTKRPNVFASEFVAPEFVPEIILVSEPESGQPLPALVQILMQRGDWLLLFSQTSRHRFEMPALPTDSYAFPNHCDGSTLPQVIHTLRPQHVVFIHGTPEKLLQLAELDALNSRYKLHIPSSGTGLEFPIADFFNSPSVPDVSYEGELIETETEILISLPRDITADPRWKTLSDLGLIRAQWQGNSLIIRGISQRDPRLP